MTTRPDHTDVIVVGGGLAGTTVAALLTGWGCRVRLLDDGVRADPCAQALPAGVHPLLEALGLRDRVDVPGIRRSEFAVLDWGNGSAPWRSPVRGPGSFTHGYHLDDTALTALLRERARELGAPEQPPVTVLGPVLTDDVVTGVRYRDADGLEQRALARFVIDASGPNRAISGHFGPRNTEPALARTVLRDRLPERDVDVEPDVFHTECRPDRSSWQWIIPCAGEVEFGQLCAAATESESTGELWLPWTAERLAGPGWLAVGDAAGVADPLFLNPTAVAMLAAQAAAEVVHSILAELGSPARILTRYADSYAKTLAATRTFAGFCLDPQRQRETEEQLVRGLTGLLNSPQFGPTLARVRGALEGNEPLFDCECPDGPLVAALEMAPKRVEKSLT